MNRRKRSWILGFAALVLVWLAWDTFRYLVLETRFEALFPQPIYLNHAVCALLLGGCALALAWDRFRLGERAWTGPLVAASFLLLALGGSDLWVLERCQQTAGTGTLWMLSHRNWLQKVKKDHNAQGFWEQDLERYRSAPEKYFVIAALGDSFTYGQGLPSRNQRFTDVLDARLKAWRGDRYQVLNFGTRGSVTRDARRTIRQILGPLQPDVVLLCYLSNDIDPLPVLRGGVAPLPRSLTIPLALSPTLNYLYWNSLGPLSYQEAGRVYFTNLLFAYADEEHFSKHLEDVRGMVGAVQGIGARPIFAILPFPHMWQNVEQSFRERVYGRLEATAREAGAEVVPLRDLEAEFSPREFELSPTDGHPNPRAHAAMADAFFRWFRDHPRVLTADAGHRGVGPR